MKVVLKLSPLAKVFASVAALGGILAVYGLLKQVEWAHDWGRALLFGGAILYLIERIRMKLRASRVPKE